MVFFFFIINSFFWNSSSLSTNRKQTVYNRSNPYSTKHSQGKNEHLFFLPAFSSPPTPLPPIPPTTTTTLRPSGSEAPLLQFVWEKLCAWAVRCPWRVRSRPFDGVGVCVGGVLCCFSSFGRTTGCQSYYGSTVDTTGVSINTHARTAGSLRCL